MPEVFLEEQKREEEERSGKRKKVEAPERAASGACYESRRTNEAIINHKRAGSRGRV